eukprot:CAMPEP_0197666218 /NCGR_PEP_ID=MMETSP1338-20131121/61887_1 /TAXON_ID=43686 ORGANISM="Pelagodinium beii, Strain RCC1491" /NCGR_SAMPLE_ID=MMETSP1338 /ASSEMBLY_ACC=CAM_ASM_000754 /LENGTH=326 /DNA_ID=CAMNT_0043245217 /DNA_START=33 /DNA_END=1016 /DNA_ORIENTATION=+
MAPTPKAAACNLDKENKRPEGDVKAKVATAQPKLRRALTDRGNLGGTTSTDEKKGPATAKAGTSPRVVTNAVRPGTAPRRTGASTNLQKTRKGPAPDPWEEVRQATAQADKLQAELAGLEKDLQEAEAEALQAEAEEQEAEQQLTSKTAEMLDEYAAAHKRFGTLQEDLKSSRERLEAFRKENLELSRRNIDLDKELKSCNSEIVEARALLEKCTSSQGTLDSEISERLKACEELREAAKVQCERLSSDLRRFSTMKARLLELAEAAGQERQKEAQRLAEEADTMAEKTRAKLEECQQVVRDGVALPAEELNEELRDMDGSQVTSE